MQKSKLLNLVQDIVDKENEIKMKLLSVNKEKKILTNL